MVGVRRFNTAFGRAAAGLWWFCISTPIGVVMHTGFADIPAFRCYGIMFVMTAGVVGAVCARIPWLVKDREPSA